MDGRDVLLDSRNRIEEGRGASLLHLIGISLKRLSHIYIEMVRESKYLAQIVGSVALHFLGRLRGRQVAYIARLRIDLTIISQIFIVLWT